MGKAFCEDYTNEGETSADDKCPPMQLLVVLSELHLIMTADAIALLPGWRTSKGVAVELAFSELMHLPIYEFNI